MSDETELERLKEEEQNATPEPGELWYFPDPAPVDPLRIALVVLLATVMACNGAMIVLDIWANWSEIARLLASLG